MLFLDSNIFIQNKKYLQKQSIDEGLRKSEASILHYAFAKGHFHHLYNTAGEERPSGLVFCSFWGPDKKGW